MTEAPKKIWIYGKQWQETPEFYPRTFESDKPMVSKKSYIRADIVDELVRALNGVIAWDKTRNFLIPYCVRDPIHAALAKLEESHD